MGAKVTSANDIYQNSNIQIFISEISDKHLSLIGGKTELLVAPLGKNR